jgi:hypothetical protein
MSQLQGAARGQAHKVVTHVPPPALPPAPRLAAQLFVAAGQLVAVAIFAVGLATVISWLIAVPEAGARGRAHQGFTIRLGHTCGW